MGTRDSDAGSTRGKRKAHELDPLDQLDQDSRWTSDWEPSGGRSSPNLPPKRRATGRRPPVDRDGDHNMADGRAGSESDGGGEKDHAGDASGSDADSVSSLNPNPVGPFERAEQRQELASTHVCQYPEGGRALAGEDLFGGIGSGANMSEWTSGGIGSGANMSERSSVAVTDYATGARTRNGARTGAGRLAAGIEPQRWFDKESDDDLLSEFHPESWPATHYGTPGAWQ